MKRSAKILLLAPLFLIAVFPYVLFVGATVISARPRPRADVCSDFTILSRTNIRLGNPEVLCNVDDHEGWLGDGTWKCVLRYQDDSLLHVIAGSLEWLPLPLPDTLARALKRHAGGDADIYRLMLAVGNGYFFFLDRMRSADNTDPKDASWLLSRPSENYTLAVYDADSSTLYILEEDT